MTAIVADSVALAHPSIVDVVLARLRALPPTVIGGREAPACDDEVIDALDALRAVLPALTPTATGDVLRAAAGELQRVRPKWSDAECRTTLATIAREASTASVTDARAFIWSPTREIFESLPPMSWCVEGLRIGVGRPTLLIGKGASAKTLAAQALGLACAAGAMVWGHYHTRPMVVRHIDHEQGRYATFRRYQRLALGTGTDPDALGGRLQASLFPPVHLDDADAIDAYQRACEGADLVIIDSLCAATCRTDENDAAISACLSNLSLVSERTGTAFIVLHHAGKGGGRGPKGEQRDVRDAPRGHSSIYANGGCVLLMESGKRGEPRRVQQTKDPASGTGGGIDPFLLAVEDVPIGTDTTAGVRVVYRPMAEEDPQAEAAARLEHDCGLALDVVRRHPDQNITLIRSKAGISNARTQNALAALEYSGRIVSQRAGRRAVYRAAGAA